MKPVEAGHSAGLVGGVGGVGGGVGYYSEVDRTMLPAQASNRPNGVGRGGRRGGRQLLRRSARLISLLLSVTPPIHPTPTYSDDSYH